MTDEEAEEIRRVLFDLVTVYEGIVRREQDTFARLEAMRDVLQRKGVMAEEDFDANYAVLKSAGETGAASVLQQLELLRVLVQHKGPAH